MKGQNRNPPLRLQTAGNGLQQFIEHRKFMIHLNAKRLKGPLDGRFCVLRLDSVFLQCIDNEPRKAICRLAVVSMADDFFCDQFRMRLVGIFG